MKSDFAYDTILRYAVNSAFSAAAAHFGLEATQVNTGENLIYAALTASIAACAWGWGLYRSTRQQKMLDVANSPNTAPTVKSAIIQANPDLLRNGEIK